MSIVWTCPQCGALSGCEHLPPVRVQTSTYGDLMPVREHQAEIDYLRRALYTAEQAWAAAETELEILREIATVACEAEFTSDRLAAMNNLRSVLYPKENDE